MAALSRVGEIVRRHDPDRFFTALFAPAAKRETLFTLYAFNHELARAREVAREPMMALIRLQWWREVIEGARRRHEVAGPLGELLDQGLLHPPSLLAMIEGREAEAEGITDAPALCEAVLGSAGGLGLAAGRSLGAGGAAVAAIQDLAAAYGAAGVLRGWRRFIPRRIRRTCWRHWRRKGGNGWNAAGRPGCPGQRWRPDCPARLPAGICGARKR